MNSADWKAVPGYGQRGVDILADLEAAEKERNDLLHEQKVYQHQMEARAEAAEKRIAELVAGAREKVAAILIEEYPDADLYDSEALEEDCVEQADRILTTIFGESKGAPHGT